ncbi:MAG: cysteine desulfurase-like protein [Clostridia bacterium]
MDQDVTAGAGTVRVGEAIRAEFPSLQREQDGRSVVYLDGPGGSQVPRQVIDAVSRYYERSNANTHGAFATSVESDAVIHGAREAMRDFLHAEQDATLSFGANMTSLNFALARGLARTLKPGDEVVVTELDHDGNVAPWLSLAERGAVIRWASLHANQVELDMEALCSLIGPRTRIVALGLASNAIGTITDPARVREKARQVGATLVLDAVHYAPHHVVDVTRLQPDFLLCSAYKFFGPHVGILYGAPGALDLVPTDRVRPQEPHGPSRIETGTLNHAALAGVAAAVDAIAGWAPPDPSRRERLRVAMQGVDAFEADLFRMLWDGLSAINGVVLYGRAPGTGPRTPTLGFTLEGRHAEEVAAGLAQRGIFAWSGDFYAVTVVDRLDLRGQGGLVRLGLAPYNTAEEMGRTIEAIREIARGAG